MDKVLFTVNKKTLASLLMIISNIIKCSTSYKKYQVCEFTLSKNKITINTAGFSYHMEAETSGGAKFTTNIIPLTKAIRTFSDSTLSFTLSQNLISCGTFRLDVVSTFINTDRILRKIDLPINFGKGHLVNLLSGKYTSEELEFNKIIGLIHEAENDLKSDITRICNILSDYGVSAEDVNNFVRSKLI
jgi:hypothetical protein